MADEISTGGGSAIEGNVSTQRFTGRDHISNISYENNQYLQFIRDQIIDVKARILIMEQEIVSLRERSNRGATESKLQFGNILAAIIIALALFYFGNGLFDLARELHTGNTIQQRIQQQRNYATPERIP